MNMINKLKVTAVAILLLLGLTSCEKDLNQAPFSELSESSFWLNNKQAKLGVGAIYNAMNEHYGERYFYYGAFRSDNYTNSGFASGRDVQFLENTLAPSNSIMDWTDLYRVIARANLAIQKIPKIPNYDENLLGEAYAARAYAYFDAARVWGKVPLYLKPVESSNDSILRPTTDGATLINEVVIPDMKKAAALIDIPSRKFRFSQTSVWALQASVYMWQKEYKKAKMALNNVINSGRFSLVTNRKDWRDLFLNDLDLGREKQDGPELIMSLDFDPDAGIEGEIFSLFNTGIPSFLMSAKVDNEWTLMFPTDSLDWVAKYPDPADLPKTFIKDDAGNPTDSRLFGDWRYYGTRESGALPGEAVITKWNVNGYNHSTDNTNVVLFRYSGVLLMLAEAENQLENPSKALDLVNQIRTARQLPNIKSADWSSRNKFEREDQILVERQLELFGEAKRWWDLRRTNRAVEVMNPINGQNEATLPFPIYVDHIIDNPNLEQVAGYN